MHIESGPRRDRNVLAAWALAVSDEALHAAEQASGMSGAGPAALVAIAADPNMSIDELRQLLSITHSGAVRLVDRLVGQGLVRRTHGMGRTVHLQPTQAGHAVEREIAAARERAVADRLQVLSNEDLAVMARLVEPMLALVIDNPEAMRHLCRLCDRSACTPCPVENLTE